MKQRLLILILAIIATISVHGQSGHMSFSIRVNDCDNQTRMSPDMSNAVEANFRADKTFGPGPLTVHFEDRSTGNPVRWRWIFGDGTIDSVQNPVHTYPDEGIYTVKLSVFDSDSAVSIDSRTDFIRVVGYGLCDSVNYDIPGSYYLYRLPGAESGFLSGNNSRGDLAKASYFSVNEDKGMLMGGLFFFALKTVSLTTDPAIVFKAWDSDGPQGTPGTVMDSTTILLSDIPVDDQGTGIYPATIPFFDKWISISDGFYLGFEMPQTAGDSLAVFTNKIESAIVGNGWEKDAGGQWRTYVEGTPGYNVDNAIFPVICQPTGIDNHILNQDMIIYPVPADEQVYISFFNGDIQVAQAAVVDLSGRIVTPETTVRSGGAVDVSRLTPGLYILRLETPKGTANYKIMVK